MKSPLRRAKIVATLGPSSSDQDTIENLIKSGVNVFRLNFSHGAHADHKDRFDRIRKAAKKLNRSIAILQDLQGPKLRVGTFEGGSIQIEKGEEVRLVLEKSTNVSKKSSVKTIPYNYELLASEIKPRHRILLDDGNMELVVTEITKDEIKAQVVFGGLLKDKKGMNFPDTAISIKSFTPKDREDLLFGLELGVDFVALSFVRTADDVKEIQKFMHSHKKNIPVVSKIEKAEAIKNFPEILEVTDCVMVARGDLAVEVGTAQVPSLQKYIIRECNMRGIPVITATQMLESMVNTPRPTRAEASDVANAILDGTDAVMLSAETASGKFPTLTVSVMSNIIHETELRFKNDHKHELEAIMSLKKPKLVNEPSAFPVVEAIEHAAANIANWVDAKSIVCTTHTGRAARALARYRPTVPIYAFTDIETVMRQLALVWGIECFSIKAAKTQDEILHSAENTLVEKHLLHKNDLIVYTAGWPALKYGTTNFLKVYKIQKETEVHGHEGKKKSSSDELIGYRTKRAQFTLDRSLCVQCGGCVEVCPNDIFGIQNRQVYLKEPNCKLCTFDNACMEICPTNAIEVIRLDD